jgi:carboxymethylenebutenolidase
MGGGYALALATRGGIAVSAVNYGGVPASLEELRGVCPVVASYGLDDKRFAGDGRRLDDFLAALGIPHDVKMYEGATHSFMNADRGEVTSKLFGVRYHRDAAEDAWSRTLAFFDDRLRTR